MKKTLFWMVAASMLLAGCSSRTGEAPVAAPQEEATAVATIEAPARPAGIPTPSPSLVDAQRDAAEKVFAGAECYGERLAPCLSPNPQVEALAQDPQMCQGWDVRVCLVPMGFVRADLLQAIVEFHKRTANIDVVILPSIRLTSVMVDDANSQLSTKTMYELMKRTYITTGTASSFIGISSIDQKGDEGGWQFGARYSQNGFSDQHGMFSYFRMANVAPYDGRRITDDLIFERASKYVGRYTAVLLLDFPYTEDIDYLNYYEMYGFSDLDSLGTRWPEGSPPCLGPQGAVCIIPDREYKDPKFEADVFAAADRIQRETGIGVEVRADALTSRYVPSRPDWGREFVEDLALTIREPYHYPDFPIVGITDDSLAQDSSVTPHLDQTEPLLRMSVVSGFGAGKPGTAQHKERIYRLLLRGVLVAQFGMELNDDSRSLLYRGVTSPDQLDDLTIPPIPK